jgi:hypothetical protein
VKVTADEVAGAGVCALTVTIAAVMPVDTSASTQAEVSRVFITPSAQGSI